MIQTFKNMIQWSLNSVIIVKLKSMEIKKTNAARILDRLKIKYELVPYEVDETELGAEHIASLLNEDIRQVFKTIVLRGDKNGILVCTIPGNEEVHLKTVAKLSGNKSIEPVAVKELLGLTGYIRGGCSPIGLKKPYPIFIHESINNFEYVYVSAGVRGLQFKIAPADLIAAAKATVAKLTE